MSAPIAFVCPHLQPFLTALQADGATVVRTETGWSNVQANIVLSAGPTLLAAAARWSLPAGVSLWKNDDGHYSLENGLSCAPCRISVSWPRPERLGS